MSATLRSRWIGGVVRGVMVIAQIAVPGTLIAQRDATQAPARDTAVAARAGTGAISGVVTSDEPNGKPVRRAIVQVSSAEGFGGRLAVTDEQGRFELPALPAGRYTLSVNKPGWVRSYYGARRLWRLPAVPIVVADGQRVANLAVKIMRGAVISGRVRDANGLPLVNARAMVLEYRTIAGVRRLEQFFGSGTTALIGTDDRGEYRHYGLPPGAYVVAAAPPAIGAASGFRVTSPADIQWATQSGQPAQPGTTAVTAAGPPPAQAIYGYEPTYYPGVSDPTAATMVTVAPGEERTGIDLTVRQITTARIQGSVVRNDGLPVIGAQIALMREGDSVSVSSQLDTGGTRASVDARGQFTLPSVRPGRYVLTARAASRPPERQTGPVAGGMTTMQNPMDLWAMAPVTIDGQNIDGLSLMLQPGINITGRVLFEATTLAAPTDLSRTRVQLLPASMMIGGTLNSMNVSMVSPAADGTFVLPGVAPDRYMLGASGAIGLTASGSPAWVLKSVIVNGRDVVDVGFDVPPGQDLRDVVITFTDRTSEISGQLVDAKGQPVPGFHVFVFPTDKSAWAPTSRRFRPPVRPDSTGRYRLLSLPPGEYYIAALTEFEEQDIQDASFIEQIIPAAIKVTIAEGEKKIQDIKLAGG